MLMFVLKDALILGGCVSIQEGAARFRLDLLDTLKISGTISAFNCLAKFLSYYEAPPAPWGFQLF